jgi:chromatin segregation and condensation protein Rec8/ScpA/Scc1 (kleisin family)
MQVELQNEYITKGDYLYHWEQEAAAHANMTKAVEQKFNEQKEVINHMSLNVEKILPEIVAIKNHLAELNHSTAKHEQRLNSQDVMNAQTALTQQQTTEKLKEILNDKKETRTFWRGAIVPVIITAGCSLLILVLVKTGILNLQQDTVAGHDDIQQAVTDALLEYESTQ